MNRKIGLIPGTGKQSRGIALRLGLAGYEVMLGSRTLEKAQKSAKELNEKIKKKCFTSGTNSEVAKNCNLLFLVIPYQFIEETIEELKPYFLKNTILIDVNVPLKFDAGYVYIDKNIEENSISELLAKLVPKNVTVVGGFKTVSATILNEIENHMNIDIFLTSDNQDAKEELQNILSKIEGLRILDAGPLRFSETTEQMTAFVINLNKLNKIKHASYKMISSD